MPTDRCKLWEPAAASQRAPARSLPELRSRRPLPRQLASASPFHPAPLVSSDCCATRPLIPAMAPKRPASDSEQPSTPPREPREQPEAIAWPITEHNCAACPCRVLLQCHGSAAAGLDSGIHSSQHVSRHGRSARMLTSARTAAHVAAGTQLLPRVARAVGAGSCGAGRSTLVSQLDGMASCRAVQPRAGGHAASGGAVS
jgi:hypothetical protein